MASERPVPGSRPIRSPGPGFAILACVGTSFSTWARNAPAFGIVSVVCQVPVLLLLRFAEEAFPRPGAGALVLGIGAVLLSLLSWNLSLGAMTFGVLEDLRGGHATIRRCLGVAFRTLPRLFGISFRMALHLVLGGGPVVGLAVMVSAFLPLPVGDREFEFLSGGRIAFLAGVLGLALLAYLAAFATSGPVAVVEGLDHWRSMERSRRLSFGRRFAVCATLLLVAAGPVAFSVWLRFFARGLDGVPQSPETWEWVGSGFDVLVVAPLLGAAVATIYRDLRRERDGVEAEALAGVFE